MKLTQRVIEVIKDWSSVDSEGAMEHFQANYLVENSGRDLEQVKDHFKACWEAVLQELTERTGLLAYKFLSVVEPSLEDTTWSALIFNPHLFGEEPSVLLHYDSSIHRTFVWESREDMEYDLERLVEECIRKLARANIRMKPAAMAAAL